MAHETVYMLQTFNLIAPKRFRFDRPVIYGELKAAMTAVEETRGKAGLIVHEVTGDPVSLTFDEPVIVHSMGAVPDGMLVRRETPAETAAIADRVAAPKRLQGTPVEAPFQNERFTFQPVRV